MPAKHAKHHLSNIAAIDALQGRNQLVAAVAPHMHGAMLGPRATPLARLGGAGAADQEGGVRGNIHLLLVGDPATGMLTSLLHSLHNYQWSGLGSEEGAGELGGRGEAANANIAGIYICLHEEAMQQAVCKTCLPSSWSRYRIKQADITPAESRCLNVYGNAYNA